MMETPSRRFGLYYSPTTSHYRQADLEAYLPILQRIGAGWLVVRSTASRAIPEAFLRGLLRAGITPFVHFILPWDTTSEEVSPILQAYGRWGVRHVAFFDRPNRRAFWGKTWGKPHLPSRFVDAFLPLAVAAEDAGLQPFFPPLTPGGDYWDLAFLRAALTDLRRRDATLTKQVGLCAYAWSEGHPLEWGRGGPEIWPQAQPYHTPPDSEDQRGFHIFDWYTVEARAAWGHVPPIFLLGMGSRYGHEPDATVEAKNTAIARRFWENDLPEAVIGGAFWLLTAPAGSPQVPTAWLDAEGHPRPIIKVLTKLAASRRWGSHHPATAPSTTTKGIPPSAHHYVLLPIFPEGLPPQYLSAVFPWLQSGLATVGFRIEEALQATHLTVIGRPEDYPPTVRQALAKATPPPQWIPLPGMDVASSGISPRQSEDIA